MPLSFYFDIVLNKVLVLVVVNQKLTSESSLTEVLVCVAVNEKYPCFADVSFVSETFLLKRSLYIININNYFTVQNELKIGDVGLVMYISCI